MAKYKVLKSFLKNSTPYNKGDTISLGDNNRLRDTLLENGKIEPLEEGVVENADKLQDSRERAEKKVSKFIAKPDEKPSDSTDKK